MMIPKAFQTIYRAIAMGKGQRSKNAMVMAGAIALLNATAGLAPAVEMSVQPFDGREVGEEIALTNERLANLENRDRILEQLAALKTLGDAIETRNHKAQFLLQLGQVYGVLGATDQALDTLKEAETLAERSEQLVAIATTYREMEERDRALGTLETAKSLLNNAEQLLPYQWVSISQIYRTLDAEEQALDALIQAEATTS
ncbi:MAG: hypothetical protein ACFCBU_03875, partial [Cyanophyceae cyanobacterium]